MLILIYGVSGMCGQACARAALKAGHQVRGLGRSPHKVDSDLSECLESFVKSENIYDLPALNKAVLGVDAIISAVAPVPEVILEGQLLLLRTAELAGVKIFHAATWNFDWRSLPLGEIEIYDSLISFWNHARISSSVNPIHGFTGIILEYMFFYAPGGNPINTTEKTFMTFGTGDEVSIYTTISDLAAYTIQAISEPNAADGGVYHVESFRCSNKDMAQIYEQARGYKLEMITLGSAADLDKLLEQARASVPPTKFMQYNGLAFGRHLLRGSLDFVAADSRRWAHIQQTGLKQWLEQHPDV
ncbi:NAD(P)-binding protein [Thozetella sp. PMI_491]|nr:NAD(P)-binding protein [Thozetella sp. PMI_491]